MQDDAFWLCPPTPRPHPRVIPLAHPKQSRSISNLVRYPFDMAHDALLCRGRAPGMLKVAKMMLYSPVPQSRNIFRNVGHPNTRTVLLCFPYLFCGVPRIHSLNSPPPSMIFVPPTSSSNTLAGKKQKFDLQMGSDIPPQVSHLFQSADCCYFFPVLQMFIEYHPTEAR